VTQAAGSALYEQLVPYADQLRSIFIVSSVRLVSASEATTGFEATAIEGLSVQVDAAAGQKCQRCWVHDPAVGDSAAHPEICPRCKTALREIH